MMKVCSRNHPEKAAAPVMPLTSGPMRRFGWSAGLAALIAASLAGQPSFAAGLPVVDFEPPAIETRQICVPRDSDAEIAERWADWDRRTLAGMKSELVRRDMRRLMEIDAPRWKPVYARVVDLLPSIDASYGDDKKLFDTIEMRLLAGEGAAVKSEGLVQKAMGQPSADLPRNQRRLAQYLLTGQGIALDRERGIALMIDAARGGDAGALLALAEYQSRGVELPGWNVDQKMTVMLGFASQVGALNPTICDRVVNIARAYGNGIFVEPDYDLAEKWYRFAADLGDANAAYAVFEMHLRSEKIVKDNAVMLQYLHQAAQNGSPSVLVALGRIYEEGALVPRDLAKAEALYGEAAKDGSRNALVRQALFLEHRADIDPSYRPRFQSALTALMALDDAPGWAFARAGQLVLETKGRWAGEKEAMALFERGVALGDTEAVRGRALLRLTADSSMASFYSGVDDLIFAVEQMGKTGAVEQLVEAHLCKAPEAPLMEEAAYWEASESVIPEKINDPLGYLLGSVEPDKVPQLPRDLIISVFDHAIAQLPEKAALADLARLADASALAPSEQKYWQRVAALLRRTAPQTAQDYQQVLQDNLLLQFAQHYPESADTPSVLEALAQNGKGKAMFAVMQSDPARFPDEAAVFKAYEAPIRARGDFDASLIALRQSGPEERGEWMRHSRAELSCIFSQVRKLVVASGRAQDTDQLRHWLGVSDVLADQEGPWARTQMGDLYAEFAGQLGPDAPQKAQHMYAAAYEQGDRTAVFRLLPAVEKPKNAGFNPTRAADLYVALAERTDGDDIPALIERIAAADPAVRRAIGARIDPQALYLRAAQAGNAGAMRQYARMTGDAARTPAEIAEAQLWMTRAAEAGDTEAMLIEAQSLALGVSGAPDPQAAQAWLIKAADLGNDQAQALLRSMKLNKVVTQ